MLEAHTTERQIRHRTQRLRMLGRRLRRRFHDVTEILERYFGFAIHINEVADFLQWAEDKERVDVEREVLPECDAMTEDQVQHDKRDRRAQEVDYRPLNEAKRTDILHLL